MSWNYYVYYRVDAAKTGPCAVAIEFLLDAMKRETGIA